MNVQKKILIIDDEEDVIRYFETFFNDNGYSVISARNGKEGFDKAVAELPDLITLDITMPEESGVRALRDLSEDMRTSNIPVFIVTGISIDFKKFISNRKNVKLMAYFEKPVNMKLMLEKVRELIG